MDFEREKAFNQILTHLMSEDPETLKKAYVEAATKHDPDLQEMARTYLDHFAGRREIGSLIDQSINQVLHTKSLDASRSLDQMASCTLPPGTVVGGYVIDSVLGNGGMGTVYKVQHSREGFPAALKIVRITTPQALHQFAEECGILAKLKHPNIAHYLDSGSLADGRPWLAMEYVEGVSLSRYCREQKPDIETRVNLFMALCRAVGHAHQRGVIHCDLKPGNILVTPTGELKLLDFGIARTVGGEEPPYAVMTPEYASPEQIHGKNLTTTTDVYTLGVLFFQLLTGVLPYSFERPDSEHIRAVIGSTVVTRPSLLTTGDQNTTRALRGDLDSIILKAMNRRADLRYQTAGALLADLRRYQAGEPIEARGASWHYRTPEFLVRKFVPAGLATAGSLLIALLIAALIHLGNSSLESTSRVKFATLPWLETADDTDSVMMDLPVKRGSSRRIVVNKVMSPMERDLERSRESPLQSDDASFGMAAVASSRSSCLPQ